MRTKNRKKIAIIGGTGFVGRALAQTLAPDHDLVVLTRRSLTSKDPAIEYRTCDLFSVRQIEESLVGCEQVVYLVHSMSTGSGLTQASFEDLDLMVADNMARACQKMEVRQIVYLGGLIPDKTSLSPHLRSRLEVERALAAGKTPVTTLRAGLILGQNGSSYQILSALVRKLPVMVLPVWTRSQTQPVSLNFVVEAMKSVLEAPSPKGQTLDLASFPVMSYSEMMRRTARAMDRPAWHFHVPFSSPTLSKLWVRLFAPASWSLISPLVESLQHDMVARPGPFSQPTEDFPAAIRACEEGKMKSPRLRQEPGPATGTSAKKRVRSVQRLPLPPGRDANWLTLRYALWLQKSFQRFLNIEFARKERKIYFRLGKYLLLELTLSEERSETTRLLYHITGGLLADSANRESRGRLEFRKVATPGTALGAIHDFVPRLPWFFYLSSQAPVHLAVMNAFRNYLVDYSRRKTGESPG